ncbi:MAG: Wzz/FepE/Etk N-terminal domain-containing protein [Candidatus Cloacimonetes bacterium]|nr:Wzz/FepE/Etk N-terminal domain-containing protein [Candidatus Cloacimonadota bacterium]MDD4147086.1 Wzz/FepE/Etk N-terminal domain-containing protein [Candidatus Cloacimonadota bacterium]MDD4559488.1 Wzz/FepE/Etk N-terminal domain-containing protein [Candidatus Cloacimonadota bacterium]
MNELDLIEVIRIILKNKGLIIAIVSFAAIVAVVYSLLTPQIWKSEATFYALSDKDIELSASSASMSKLARDLMEQNMQNETMTAIDIINSRRLSEEVIHHFKLIEYFKLKSPDPLTNMDDALEKLKKVVQISFSEDNYLITLAVETKSRALSRDIADFYLSSLEAYLRQNRIVKGRQNRIFLEGRVNEIRHSIDSLRTEISKFQSKHHAVDLEEQSTQLIAQYSRLMTSKMKLEIELELASSNYPASSVIVQDILSQISITEKQIRDLEESDPEAPNKFQLDLSRLPSLSAKMALMQMNLNILMVVHDYVRPEYEKALLEEQKNLPQLEILDTPRKAGLRERPRRAVICIVTVFMATVFSILLAIVKEIIFSQPERLRELKHQLHEKQDSNL